MITVDARFGRTAKCSCKAGRFGLACRHIRFVQGADSVLTGAPVREIREVAA